MPNGRRCTLIGDGGAMFSEPTSVSEPELQRESFSASARRRRTEAAVRARDDDGRAGSWNVLVDREFED